MMALTVELEIRPDQLNTNFFFVLDDAVQGILQETNVIGSYDYVLGGSIMVEITEYVRSVNISRGKSRATDTFSPGLANVTFNNHDRAFDPVYSDSPLFTYIKPKRAIRISFNQNPMYLGVITDWNLDYQNNGDSVASAACADALSLFQTQALAGGLQTEELSNVRVNKILDQLTWPQYIPFYAAEQNTRIVFEGSQTLGADEIEEGTNALEDLQLIERSEPGKFYVDTAGRPVFLGRNSGRNRTGELFSDAGDGIPYSSIDVQFGSEYLFNETIISSAITSGTAVASDLQSQEEYGLSSLVRTELLMSSDTAAAEMAVALTARFSEPEFRFSGLTVIDANPVTIADLGFIVRIKFTPNGIGDAIERFAEVIGVSYDLTPSVSITSFDFETISNTAWTLSDEVFGRLSAGNTLAY
jgi:hypothetical protein